MENKLFDILCGKTEGHLEQVRRSGTDVLIHSEVVAPLTDLARLASENGFELALCSGFRSYSRQLKIWNEKVEGKRPLLDHDENPVVPDLLEREKLLFTILRWSAVPGTSRHHWGTDIDVFDKKAVPSGYKIKLTNDEVWGEGVFAPFHNWLDEAIRTDSAHGFYRPYENDRGGVAPERWHLSYRPLAMKFEEQFSFEFFSRLIEESHDLRLREEILINKKTIYDRYISP